MIETIEAKRNRENIRQMLQESQDILTLPTVINEIIEITSNPNSSANDLTRIIESDPALTVKILAVANSAYYGFVQKVATISHAVVVLGFREIQNIALGMSVVRLFDQRGSAFVEKLWQHSYAVGVATRMLASYLNLKMDGKYFVGGLLHDVGKIFLFQCQPQSFANLLGRLDDGVNKYGYHYLEEATYGIDHATIGGELLARWMFPTEITEAVVWHHRPSAASTNQLFAACVHLADLLCTIRGLTPLKNNFFLRFDREVLPVLQAQKEGFGSDDIYHLLNQLDLELERQSSMIAAFKR